MRGSYYATDAASITQSARGPVTPSTNRWDPYLGGEVRWEQLIGRWDAYLSSELRWRTVYDYHKRRPDAAEDRQASVNLIAGIKLNGINKASPFLRYYRGVNPHGQFRNQKNYSELGLGVRLVR